MVQLREGCFPFGIKGQGDQGAISVGPLPSFDWQESHIRVGLDLGLGHMMMPSKGQGFGVYPIVPKN